LRTIPESQVFLTGPWTGCFPCVRPAKKQASISKRLTLVNLVISREAVEAGSGWHLQD
jgi:hypothetical protein